MGLRLGALVVGAAVAGWLAGCSRASTFECDGDTACLRGSTQGICQSTHYCSFPDSACTGTEQRYGALAPAPLAGACVPPGVAGSGTGVVASSTSPSRISATSTTLSSVSVSTSGTSSGQTGTTGAIDPDLVAWYRLDGSMSAGITGDSSGNGFDGTCDPGACPTPGSSPVGPGGEFDGVDDVVRVTSNLRFETTDGFTLAAWVRLDTFPLYPEYRHILAKPVGVGNANSWEVFVRDDDQDGVPEARFGMTGSSSAGEVGVPLSVGEGEWFHVAATWEPSRGGRVFVDGQPGPQFPLADVVFDDHDVFLGADDDNDGALLHWFWQGGMADVRIYARALTPDELATLAGG